MALSAGIATIIASTAFVLSALSSLTFRPFPKDLIACKRSQSSGILPLMIRLISLLFVVDVPSALEAFVDPWLSNPIVSINTGRFGGLFAKSPPSHSASRFIL